MHPCIPFILNLLCLLLPNRICFIYDLIIFTMSNLYIISHLMYMVYISNIFIYYSMNLKYDFFSYIWDETGWSKIETNIFGVVAYGVSNLLRVKPVSPNQKLAH